MVVWRILDGKPGHEAQSLGLVTALSERVNLSSHDMPAVAAGRAVAQWLAGRFPAGDGLPDPDLVVGAGHGTHWSLLAARRARGGKAVVLMRPSLPARWFDLCVIPVHDDPPAVENIFPTRGVLNNIRPSRDLDPGGGLVLVGGPSAHYDWDDGALLGAIGRLLERRPEVRFTLTTSRRTPASFLERVAALAGERLQLVPYADTGPGWVAAKLAVCGEVWVSEDSVSMVYEALTAGAAVGLLAVPRRGRSRVSDGVDGLLGDGWVTRLEDAGAGEALPAPGQPLDEAARCADHILGRWRMSRGG